MNPKTLYTLEYDKIRATLARYTQFSVAAKKAGALKPITQIQEIKYRLDLTQEAIMVNEKLGVGVGGVRDICPYIEACLRADVLPTQDLLDVRSTIEAAINIKKTFEKNVLHYPNMHALVSAMNPPTALLKAIIIAISEHGEVLDSASEALGKIRKEIQVFHHRIFERLESLIHDPQVIPILQEQIITQRDGRFVIPLKADFKGKIKALIHDQSASGATLFIEPLTILDLNNRFRELQLEERDEIQRILAQLSHEVAIQADVLNQIVNTIADFDVAIACGTYAQALKCVRPIINAYQSPSDKTPIIRLWQARHPLLDQKTVVPIDLYVEPEHFALIITGPNTGGKTVCLKTVGLLVLMAQSGLFIPAQEGSQITIFQDVLVDIGDEQSIEQSLSTFSGHIKNIIYILKKANKRTLVLLDELGAGTDPQEGAALARAILNFLIQKTVPLVITTHHPELKLYAHKTNGAINANVEFDLETLRPTYRLVIGLPGQSNALSIAEKLGLPREIIEDARTSIKPEEEHADQLLADIQKQREKAYKTQADLEQKKKEIYQLQDELSKRLRNIEKERLELLAAAQEKVESEIRLLRDEVRKKKRQPASQESKEEEREIQDLEKQVQNVIEEVKEACVISIEETIPTEISHIIKVGSVVKLPSLGAKGEVISIDGDEAEIQIGMMRMRTRVSLLEPTIEPVEETSTADGIVFIKTEEHLIRHASPGYELDLRGKLVEEALDILETHVQSAYLAGLPFIRIIHGKGSGKLRLAVRQVLQHHPNILTYEVGGFHEGGDGVTVAKLLDD